MPVNVQNLRIGAMQMAARRLPSPERPGEFDTFVVVEGDVVADLNGTERVLEHIGPIEVVANLDADARALLEQCLLIGLSRLNQEYGIE